MISSITQSVCQSVKMSVEPMHIKDFFTENRFFLTSANILEYEKTHNDMKCGKEVKTTTILYKAGLHIAIQGLCTLHVCIFH